MIRQLKLFFYRTISFLYLALVKHKSQYLSNSFDQKQLDNPFSPYKRINSSHVDDWILIYAATIGELKAASFFLQKIQQVYVGAGLILIPGQIQYANAYSELYPNAQVIRQFPVSPTIVDQFFLKYRIKFCVFVEGPSLHGFFPIRQDLSLPIGCLSHQVPIVIINGCLYKKHVHSRIDAITYWLFSGLFQDAIKHWYVPTVENYSDLVRHKVSKNSISVVGDIKFDNIFSDYHHTENLVTSEYIKNISGRYRLIVAGSVNALEEQKALVDAWLHINTHYSDIMLVIAPRYINDTNMMGKLTGFLRSQNIHYAMRSEGVDAIVNNKLIIVDTFGELPCFYQHAEIAFAGRGHGVLEPMKYLKPVVVGPHQYWTQENSTSYLLYHEMRDNQALIECSSYDELGGVFMKLLEDKPFGDVYVQRYTKIIKGKMGASEKILEHMSKLLSTDRI